MIKGLIHLRCFVIRVIQFTISCSGDGNVLTLVVHECRGITSLWFWREKQITFADICCLLWKLWKLSHTPLWGFRDKKQIKRWSKTPQFCSLLLEVTGFKKFSQNTSFSRLFNSEMPLITRRHGYLDSFLTAPAWRVHINISSHMNICISVFVVLFKPPKNTTLWVSNPAL